MNSNSNALNPFPGLRPFHQEEDYLFFGREEQTMELLERLGNNRFVAVVGTSGSGKSSLVRCGLLTELLGGKMLRAGASWEVAVTHPGGNPLALLAESILEADLYDSEEEHVRENLLATLSRSHFGLVEAIKQARLDEGTNFLLVVDQFEEIFRFNEAGEMQQEIANEFISILLESVLQSEVPIYVVLTMRSDFIGDCGEFEGLAEMVNRGEFLIPRLSREQYKRVIEAPIKVAGGQITPRLLQRLLNDLGQQADQLPCLQHALMRTWSKWSDRSETEALDLDDYQSIGKMSQALSLHADEIFESFSCDRQRELYTGIFQALTVQETENRGIRRPQRLESLCQILEVPKDEVIPIIDAYRQQGVTFLMPPPEVELTDKTIIDISHESLMRVWTRLRQWVDEEAQAVGIYRRLSESAALYEKGKAGLYHDPELGIALSWREARKPNKAWAERYHPGFDEAMSFLDASQKALIAEEEQREADRQRELEQARLLAEVEKRAARRLRVMVVGLAVVATFAVISSVVAFNYWLSADSAKLTAELSEKSAQQNAKTAQSEAERATAQEAAAKNARQDAENSLVQARSAIDDYLIKVSDSDLLSTPGMQPLRAELLESAGRFYEGFLEEHPDDPSLQAGLADAFRRVGIVNNELANIEAAQRSLEKAIELYQTAIENDPDNPDLRHGLASCWYQRGISIYLGGASQVGYAQTNVFMKNAARIWDQLVRDFPKNVRYKKDLARAYNGMGVTFPNLSQREASILAFQQSLRIRLDLLPDNPDDVELLHGMGESFSNISNSITDRQLQLKMDLRALEFYEIAHSLRPQNVEYAMDLSLAYSSVRLWLYRAGRRQESFEAALKGAEHATRFIRGNPSVPGMRGRLGISLSILRGFPLQNNQADDCLRIFRNVHDLFTELPRKTPDDHFNYAKVQSELVSQIIRARKTIQKIELTPAESAEIESLRDAALQSLRQAVAAGYADVQQLKSNVRLADLRASRPAFNELIAQLENPTAQPVVAQKPVEAASPAANEAHRQLLQDRATGYLAFSAMESYYNLLEQADESLEETLRIRKQLAEADPENQELKNELLDANEQLADLRWKQGKLARGRELYLSRIAPLQKTAGENPDDKAAATRLAEAHRKFGDLLANAGLWEEAPAHIAKSLKYQPKTGSEIWLKILAPAVLLLANDDEAYRDACAQILVKFGNVTHPEHAARVARLCALLPGAVDDLSPVLNLAEKAKYTWHAYTNALVLHRAGRFEEAIQTLDNKDLAGFFVSDFVLAMSHFQLGHKDQALKILQKVNDQTPQSMPSWSREPFNMLDVDWFVLRREANEMIYGSPFSPDDRLSRGRAYALLDEPEKAAVEFASAAKINPDDPALSISLAYTLAKTGKAEQADAALDNVAALHKKQGGLNLTDLDVLRTYGEALSLRNRTDDAVKSFRRAVAIQSLEVIKTPTNSQARSILNGLKKNLVETLQTAGREADAQAARDELEMLFSVFDIPGSFENPFDLFVETSELLPDDRLSLIDQLVAANTAHLDVDDLLGRHLSARFGHRKAEILRDAGRDIDEVRAAYTAAVKFYQQILAADGGNADVAGQLADVLLELNKPKWTVLKPVEMKSAGGATLTLQDDGSILAGGPNASRDVYTIRSTVGIPEIQAIRLEALPDPTLPNQGPGRHASGNFQLNAFRVFAASAEDGRPVDRLRIADAAASYEYPARNVAVLGTIDEDDPRFWHVFGRAGARHVAVFELATALVVQPGQTPIVQCAHRGAGLNLGRFRLSVTDDPDFVAAERQRWTLAKLTDPWARLTAAYALKSDPTKAAESIAQLLENAPNTQAKNQIFEQAAADEDVFAALVKLRPDEPSLHVAQGKSLVSKGLWNEADAAFQKATDLDAAAIPKWIQTGFWKVGLYPFEIETVYPPEANPDPFHPVAAVAEKGKKQPADLRWQAVTPADNGRIDLGNKIGCYYALTRVWSPTEQEVAFQMGDDDAMRLFVNERMLFEAKFNGGVSRPKEHEYAVALKPGWNTVLLKVQNTLGGCSVILTLSNDPQDLIAARLGTRNYQIDQLAAGKADEALKLLNALIGESPTDAVLFAKRAEAHEKLEQWERAAADWGKADGLAADKKFRYGNPNIPYMEHRARINGRLKHYDKQIEDLTALLQPERLPDHYSILSARGGTYDTLRQWDKALPDHNKAIEVAPPNWQAYLLNRRANHFALQAKWKQAVEDYAAAAAHSVQTSTVKTLAFSRDSALAHLAAGDVEGYRQQAAEMFNRLGEKMNPFQARWLVHVFTLAPDMITDANRDRLLQAVDIFHKSNERYGRRLKASVHYRLGQFEEAAKLFPNNPGIRVELHFLAAMAKFKTGDEEQALKFLQASNQWMQTMRDKDPDSALPKDGGWHKWAMLLTLKREAEVLINKTSQAKPETVPIGAPATPAKKPDTSDSKTDEDSKQHDRQDRSDCIASEGSCTISISRADISTTP